MGWMARAISRGMQWRVWQLLRAWLNQWRMQIPRMVLRRGPQVVRKRGLPRAMWRLDVARNLRAVRPR